MNDQAAVQKLLRRKLNELQARNPAFSVRAFAARLKLQPSATNEILKGERRVSRKLAERLASALHLDPSERAELLGHFPADRKRKTLRQMFGTLPSSEDRETLRLTSDQFSVISDWVHFAVLNLVKIPDHPRTPARMAERLGVSETKIQGAIERLVRLDLLSGDEVNGWKRTYSRINTPDDVLDLSVQKSHLTDMELARESLLRDPIDRRDFSSLMVAIDPELLPRAKEILRRAQDEIAELATQKPATEVYRLTNYFFPLSLSTARSVPHSKPSKKESP